MAENNTMVESASKVFTYFSNDPLYLLIFPYCFLQPVFRNWAKQSSFYEKNKAVCKKVMTFYNLFMSVFSLVCAAIMIHCLMNLKIGVYSVGHFDDEDVGWPIMKTYRDDAICVSTSVIQTSAYSHNSPTHCMKIAQ